MCPLITRRMYTDIPWAFGLGSIRGGELDLAARSFRSASAFRSRRSSGSGGDGMDGESDGDSTVESSSAATLGDTVAERFITMPRLCTEIIEDSPPRAADSERAGMRVAGTAQPQVADMPAMDMAVTDMPVTDMRAHLAAMRGRRTASPAIAEQLLTAALQGTEPTQPTEDSLAATAVSLDADPAHRGQVVSAAAEAVRRTDSLRMEAPAVRTVAGTLVADMPAVDTAAAVAVTVVADTAAGANCSA